MNKGFFVRHALGGTSENGRKFMSWPLSRLELQVDFCYERLRIVFAVKKVPLHDHFMV